MPSGPGGGELPTDGDYPILTSEAIRTRAETGARQFVVTFTARQGARPAPRAVRPSAPDVVVTPPPREPRARRAPRRGPRRRRRWPMAVALFAFALFVTIPVLALLHRSDDNTGSTQPASHGGAHASPGTAAHASPSTAVPVDPAVADRAAMVAWAQRSLSRSATIAADSATVADLRRAGFASALDFARVGTTSLPTVDYVFDVPGSALTSAPVTRLLRDSLPLALFDAERTPASVRQVFPTGLADALNRLQSNDALQRSGGAELIANRALHTDAATRALLLSGSIDLRAQNVLARLARTATIYVTDPTAEAAETRAGRPIRSVVVTTADAQQAQDAQTALDALTVPYRPSSVQDISPRKFRLSWQPAVALATSVGGNS